MRSPLLAALLISCSVPQAADQASSQAPPAPAVRSGLLHSPDAPLIAGTTPRFRISGAAPGETVYLVRTFTGIGEGSCPPPIGGNCMGILDPLAIHGSSVADGSGVAYIDMRVPAGAPLGAEIYTQAVAIRGVGGSDTALSPPRADSVRPVNGLIYAIDANLGAAPEGCDIAARVPVRNFGGGPLTLESVTVDGPFVASSPALPLVLEPDEVVNLMVQADMSGEGALAGTLTLGSDDPSGDLVVDLTATLAEDAPCPDTAATEVRAHYAAIDLTVLLDTTCSMGSVVDATTVAFEGIAADLAAFAPDVTFGVATYDDYNDAGFGSGADKPFILLTQQTSDPERAQSALDTIALHSGGDGPESTHEALLQTLTGRGYDQNCDGLVNDEDDVPPFIASRDDPFGGAVEAIERDVPGTGTNGGVGYRDGTLRFIAYATDNELRDPLDGYASPGGCPDDATSDAVVEAAAALDTKLVGVFASAFLDRPREQMEDLADRTGSIGDIDGDGDEEPAILDFTDGDAEALRDRMVQALRSLLPPEEDFEGILELVVLDDPSGIVAAVAPAAVDGARYGADLPFEVSLNGVAVDGPGAGISTATLALFHDGVRLGSVEVHGVPNID